MPPTVFIAPHLDDAVFSAAHWLVASPGSVVVTALAGAPRNPAAAATEWDSRAGFSNGKQAIDARRREDARALAILGAEPSWLDFPDRQYGEPIEREILARALQAELIRLAPTRVMLPLGLFHPDHELVADASLKALQALFEHEPPRRDTSHARVPSTPKAMRPQVLAYEDAPYRDIPGVLQERLVTLLARGVRVTPCSAVSPARAAGPLKRLAMQAYASQLRAFENDKLRDLIRIALEQPERTEGAWVVDLDFRGAVGGAEIT